MLITGGGIANFTNVAATFKGIVTALTEFQSKILDHNISIFVRRAGPNYQVNNMNWLYNFKVKLDTNFNILYGFWARKFSNIQDGSGGWISRQINICFHNIVLDGMMNIL